MGKKYQLILAIAFFIISCVFTSSAMAFKDYKGKVIDADTKEPIEGAVVAAVWTKEVSHYPSGESVIFKKARETTTDKNGEFSLKPYHHYSLRPFSELWLRWIIYKPGYGSFPRHPKVKPKGISPNGITSKIFRPYTVVELPKLKTKEERRKYLRFAHPSGVVPVEKIPLLMHAINIENIELGLKPHNIEKLKAIQKEQREEVYDRKGRLKKRRR